jgi:hypothetical protein
LSDEDLVVIPLPTTRRRDLRRRPAGQEDTRAFEAIVAVPDTSFAPPRRSALSSYSLAQLRPGSPQRPNLYLYEGMIMPAPN